MKRILMAVLFALPLSVSADIASSTYLSQILANMNITRNGWCETKDKAPDGLIEYRSHDGKRAFEIITESGHYFWLEERREKRSVERKYFSGKHVPNGRGKIVFDAVEHKNATMWEQQMGSQRILTMLYFPDMETPPAGCAWSNRKNL